MNKYKHTCNIALTQVNTILKNNCERDFLYPLLEVHWNIMSEIDRHFILQEKDS